MSECIDSHHIWANRSHTYSLSAQLGELFAKLSIYIGVTLRLTNRMPFHSHSFKTFEGCRFPFVFRINGKWSQSFDCRVLAPSFNLIWFCDLLVSDGCWAQKKRDNFTNPSLVTWIIGWTDFSRDFFIFALLTFISAIADDDMNEL